MNKILSFYLISSVILLCQVFCISCSEGNKRPKFSESDLKEEFHDAIVFSQMNHKKSLIEAAETWCSNHEGWSYEIIHELHSSGVKISQEKEWQILSYIKLYPKYYYFHISTCGYNYNEACAAMKKLLGEPSKHEGAVELENFVFPWYRWDLSNDLKVYIRYDSNFIEKYFFCEFNDVE